LYKHDDYLQFIYFRIFRFDIYFRVHANSTTNKIVLRSVLDGLAVNGYEHGRVPVHRMSHTGRCRKQLEFQTVRVAELPQRLLHGEIEIMGRQHHRDRRMLLQIENKDRLTTEIETFDTRARHNMFLLNNYYNYYNRLYVIVV